MDKMKVIKLMANVILQASKNGKDYSWMYDNYGFFEELCEELNISDEEIKDIILQKTHVFKKGDMILTAKGHFTEVLFVGTFSNTKMVWYKNKYDYAVWDRPENIKLIESV